MQEIMEEEKAERLLQVESNGPINTEGTLESSLVSSKGQSMISPISARASRNIIPGKSLDEYYKEADASNN